MPDQPQPRQQGKDLVSDDLHFAFNHDPPNTSIRDGFEHQEDVRVAEILVEDVKDIPRKDFTSIRFIGTPA